MKRVQRALEKSMLGYNTPVLWRHFSGGNSMQQKGATLEGGVCKRPPHRHSVRHWHHKHHIKPFRGLQNQSSQLNKARTRNRTLGKARRCLQTPLTKTSRPKLATNIKATGKQRNMLHKRKTNKHAEGIPTPHYCTHSFWGKQRTAMEQNMLKLKHTHTLLYCILQATFRGLVHRYKSRDYKAPRSNDHRKHKKQEQFVQHNIQMRSYNCVSLFGRGKCGRPQLAEPGCGKGTVGSSSAPKPVKNTGQIMNVSDEKLTRWNCHSMRNVSTLAWYGLSQQLVERLWWPTVAATDTKSRVWGSMRTVTHLIDWNCVRWDAFNRFH